MTTPRQAYDELRKISKELTLLRSIDSVLGWERETYMPPSGETLRADQSAYLSGEYHRKLTQPRFGELLEIVKDSEIVEDALSDAAVNIREWRHQYDRAVRVPTELVEETTRSSVMAQSAWVEARKKADFSIFQPHLANLIDLTRRKAEYIGYEENIYDALLDEYEPGETTAHVKQLFQGLRAELVPLVKAISDSPIRPRTEILHREYPIDRQRLFAQAASAAIGFDYMSGRLDTVTHPFASRFGPGDVRITTRWNSRFFNEAFFGVLHETGHGMYGQNLPIEHYGTPRGESVSLGIHESQSRLWENFVGRGRAFWRHFFPRARQVFPQTLYDVTMEEFYFAVNAVKPSYIRVEADEVTYNLHIMLRFEIEQAIISGELAVADIPGAWNELFEDFLGIKVPDDAKGCLQDVHWSFAGFGYFSTYALGNLYAAQFFAKAKEDLPNLEESFAQGDFAPLLQWLTTHIYSQGMRYRSRDLVAHVTGQAPSHEALMAYLYTKFGELYQL